MADAAQAADGEASDAATAPVSGIASAGYRWYLGAQVLSLFGTMMSYTALFWLALHVPHGGAPALAAVDAAQCLPMLLFSRRAGLLVGRHRAVRILLVTQSLEAAGALAIGAPLLVGWMTIWYLVLASFAIGCVLTVDLPARQTFMLDLTGPAELRRGVSLFATVTGLARIAGPGIAGLVIAATGETAVFFFNAASFLAVIVVLARLSSKLPSKLSGQTLPAALGSPGDQAPAQAPEQEPAQEQEPEQAQAGARRFRWLADLPAEVRAAAVMALLVGGFGWQFAVTNPLVATRIFHLGPAGFGLFGTCAAIGGIGANYWSSHREDPGPREFAAWAAVFGVAECLAAVMPVAWLYDAAMVVTGAALQLFSVSATVYILQATPAAKRGLALSAYNAGFVGSVPAGAFAVAAIASTAGVRWALIGPGLVIAIGAVALLAGGDRLALGARRLAGDRSAE